MQAQSMGLLIIGSILIGIALFLPIVSCDSSYCNKDTIALFQSDRFKDPYEFWEGVRANYFPINFVVLCIIVLVNANQGKGVFPASLSLLGLVLLNFYAIWDEVDRSSSLSLSYGWIVLILGAALVAWGGFQTRQNSYWQCPLDPSPPPSTDQSYS